MDKIPALGDFFNISFYRNNNLEFVTRGTVFKRFKQNPFNQKPDYMTLILPFNIHNNMLDYKAIVYVDGKQVNGTIVSQSKIVIPINPNHIAYVSPDIDTWAPPMPNGIHVYPWDEDYITN
jgi:hypothetical protein